MEQRKQARRDEATLITMRAGERVVAGQVRNISFDGALLTVEGGALFRDEDLGARLEIEAEGERPPELRAEAKLVRIFEDGDDGTQCVAIRFLDYMG
jgi:hypothetical protein